MRILLLVIAFAVASEASGRVKRIVGGRTADRNPQASPPSPPSEPSIPPAQPSDRPVQPSRPSQQLPFFPAKPPRFPSLSPNRPAQPAPSPTEPPLPPTEPPTPPPKTTSAPLAVFFDVTGAVTARIHGIVDKSTDPPFYSFFGLRYAEPPVRRRRFQRPIKLRLTGEVDARRPGAPCVQPHPHIPGRTTGSEDCLFLNVHTPSLPDLEVFHAARSKRSCDEDDDDPDDASLPVMVWTHGGGYRQGSANQYGPKYLVQKGIIVVTIQYRLGLLGFLSHNNRHSPGNAALFDQVLALEWVKEHIRAFGGDPNKISLAGHDTGASAAMLLSQSKYGPGLFKSVVAMSGSSLSPWATRSDPQKEADALSNKVRCPTNNTNEAVKCLMEIPAEDLVLAESEVEIPDAPSGDSEGDLSQLFTSSAPVVDGPSDERYLPTILPEGPKEGLEAGRVPPIPLLTGITKDETSNLFSAQQTGDIVKKIEEIPNYLNEKLLPKLVKTTQGLVNITDALTNTLTSHFSFVPGDRKGPLRKLVEATTDALFALPVFLTSKLWRLAGGPVFLYSFDHPSPHSASVFSSSPFQRIADVLGGRQKRQTSERDDGVGHGEDLFFLFEPKTLEGEDIPGLELNATEDKNVLDMFSSTVARFVKTGNPSTEMEGQESSWLPFSEDEDNYLSISSQPKSGKKFKFCEIGLWGGNPSRLLTPECLEAFKPDKVISGISDSFSGILNTQNTGLQFPRLG